MQRIDEDRPLSDASLDEYGLAAIAEKLAGSIAPLASSDGIVFGIEGAWGSGKTTFINFLRDALNRIDDVKVVSLSPWLMGDSRSMVGALAQAIGPLLENAETQTGKRGWLNKGRKTVKSVDLMRGYAARTGRGIVPLAKFAGLFIPGASAAGDMIELGAGALESIGKDKSDEAIKAEITKRIIESKVKFVVIIDDLDRLEPAQAVEVMRLIRSVADFPRIAYVLSYDRSVLARALETGLAVQNGDLFMQKIVQLTFSLPQPEPFDLRTSLRKKCLQLYKAVHQSDPIPDLRDDLFQAIDREGGDLRTPRDVKLVLNNVAFLYPAVASEVYFPDFCRLQLHKALRPKLYTWIERYLAVRAALVSGDASLHKADRARFGDELLAMLPDEDAASSNSIWSLRSYVPGLETSEKPESRVFNSTSERQVGELIEKQRLGSPIHHRFYFALSGPKGMIPVSRMNEIRQAAGGDREQLRGFLVEYVEEDRPLGQSWYEHLIMRLDDATIANYSFDQLTGLLMGFATTADTAERKLNVRRAFMLTMSDKLQHLVDHIIRRMRQLDLARTSQAIGDLYQKGDLPWLVAHFHRHHIFEHGLVGDHGKPEDQWTLTADEVSAGSKVLNQRIQSAKSTLGDAPDLGSLLWGWRDMGAAEDAKAWVVEQASDDAVFLQILKSLRGWAVSDRVYYPLRRSAVADFFDYDEVLARLDRLATSGNTAIEEDAQAIKVSLSQGRDRD
jgi:hypothetical protein